MNPHTYILRSVALLLTVIFAGCDSQRADDAVPARDELDLAEIEAIAHDAYVFGYPIVMSYKTWYFFFLNEDNPQFVAPMNTLKNFPRVFTHRDTVVVTPNSDTPYSFVGLDLRAEPIVLSVPEIEEGRFYSVHLADINHHNFGFLGTATTGNGAGHHMIAGPDWQGDLPEGIDTITRTDAQIGFVVFRTQLFNPDDLDNVIRIQDQYAAKTLSSFLGTEQPAPAPEIDFPAWDATALTDNFIPLLNFMLQFTTPTPDETAIRERIAAIGIGAGKAFDWAGISDEKRAAIEAGFAAARAEIAAGEAQATEFLFGDRAKINGDWMARAVAVEGAQWGKDPEQAIYPRFGVDVDGNPLDASRTGYTLTFAAGEFPPARAFWSITMYDGVSNLLVENPLERYLVNSPMLPGMSLADDGSLTVYIQHDSPGVDKEANWLPAPDGPFYMIMRLYWPKPEALDGTWTVPSVMPVPDAE